MFKIKIKNEIIKHCKEQLKRYNFGQRGYADGTPEQQLTGITGQTVISELFGFAWIDGGSGFDGGIDLIYEGLSIDVKTMGRTTDVRPYYVNNFIALQKKNEVDVYIFASYNKINHELTVVGWLPKKELLNKAKFYPKGTVRKRSDGSSFKTFTDLFEIENNKLNNVDSFDDLKKQLDKYQNSLI